MKQGDKLKITIPVEIIYKHSNAPNIYTISTPFGNHYVSIKDLKKWRVK